MNKVSITGELFWKQRREYGERVITNFWVRVPNQWVEYNEDGTPNERLNLIPDCLDVRDVRVRAVDQVTEPLERIEKGDIVTVTGRLSRLSSGYQIVEATGIS